MARGVIYVMASGELDADGGVLDVFRKKDR